MSKSDAGRKPDYNVKAMRDGQKGKVDAAWVNKDGSISVDLDPFVVLAAHEDLHITLFRNESDK